MRVVNEIPESFWIPGEPVTYATRKEKAWKETLKSALTSISPPIQDGITFEFALPTLKPHGQPVDIDNLCEPVFSVLTRLGWFRSSRSTINYWNACKYEGKEAGLHIYLEDSTSIMDSKCAPDFQIVYNGRLPQHARDHNFIEWFNRQMPPRIHQSETYSIELQFGGRDINIGDISTGKVKSIIDCLFPFIGGKEGFPEDWRIADLTVSKGIQTLLPGDVQIMIWGFQS